jgi:hypothetical protein
VKARRLREALVAAAMAWTAAVGTPAAMGQADQAPLATGPAPADFADPILVDPVCNTVSVSLSSSNLGTGEPFGVAMTVPGGANWFGVKLCPIANPSLYCWTPDWLVPYPSLPQDPVVPACAQPGLYRVIGAGGLTQNAFQCGSSSPVTVSIRKPCITGVIADTPAATGNRTTIRWATANQTRFAIDLQNGTSTWPIVGWTNSSSARTFLWDIPSNLTPGTYWVRVWVDNGIAEGSATTDSFFIQGGPTVSNVTFSTAPSCFGATSTYAGKPVTVSWTSTYQARWELYDCVAGCQLVQAGNNGNQSTVWTPSSPGNRVLTVLSINGTFHKEAQSPNLNIQPRPSVSVQWQSVNTNVSESAPQTNLAAMVTTDPPTSPLPDLVEVSYQNENGTATAGVDYGARSSAVYGPITFGACLASGSLASLPTAISIGNDTIDEIDETFVMHLTSASQASLGTLTAHTFRIIDDDAPPTLSIGDVSLVEGTGGTSTASLPVTLTGATALVATVNYTTADGSAAAGADYAAVSGTLTFAPGAHNAVIQVPVTADPLHEGTESFTVSLSVPGNAAIADGQATVTIQDDDPIPTLTILGAEVTEANAGATVDFTYQLSNPTIDTVSFAWATADGTATAGADYAPASGTRTLAPGATSGTIAVSVLGDLLDEPDETFQVALSSVVNATGGPSAPATIHDDDPPPSVSIGDASVTEVNASSVLATFDVTLSAPSGYTVTVNHATGPGTATPGADYAPASGTLTFPPGTVSRTVAVAVGGDTLDEPTETFFVDLSSPSAGTLTLGDAQGQGTILDDDPPATVYVTNASEVEGDEGERVVNVSVVVDPSGLPITVDYATADGTAQRGTDYLGTNGTLTFPPGTAFRLLPLTFLGDAVVEPNETFTVNLSAPTNATIADGQAEVAIVNDDAGFVSSVELAPGSEETADLRPVGSAPAVHLYRLGQQPRSSYEVVVDATSGDVAVPSGIHLERYAWDQTTLLQSSTPLAGGVNRSLRFSNDQFFAVNHQFLKVWSSQCTTDCGPDDVYRIRVFDTTYSVPRFNNAGQTTVLIVQNTGANPVSGWVDFWDGGGALLGSSPLAVSAKGVFVLNTSTVMPGLSGSITISNDGSYSDLVGKAVSIEPATGFAFDTPMSPRPR